MRHESHRGCRPVPDALHPRRVPTSLKPPSRQPHAAGASTILSFFSAQFETCSWSLMRGLDDPKAAPKWKRRFRLRVLWRPATSPQRRHTPGPAKSTGASMISRTRRLCALSRTPPVLATLEGFQRPPDCCRSRAPGASIAASQSRGNHQISESAELLPTFFPEHRQLQIGAHDTICGE